MKRITVPLLCILLLAGMRIGYGFIFESPDEATAIDRPHRDLVRDLDRTIQARFQGITDADIRKRRLGVSRVASLVPIHGWQFKPKNRGERLAVENLHAAGWSSALYVVGFRPAAGTQSGMTVVGPIAAGQTPRKVSVDRSAIKQLASVAALYKTPFQGGTVGLSLEARPVVASRKKCLGCHRRAQIGDALGVVVYAFQRTAAP